MATFVLYDDFGLELGKGTHVLAGSSYFYLMLSNAISGTAAQATGAIRSDVAQIAGTGGYATNGTTCGISTWAETGAGSGIWQFTSPDVVFTATTGGIPTFQYVMMYNYFNSGASYPLVGYLDYGSAVNVTDTNTFTVDVGASGWLQLTIP